MMMKVFLYRSNELQGATSQKTMNLNSDHEMNWFFFLFFFAVFHKCGTKQIVMPKIAHD
jgi:hypothetical protein